MVPGTNIKTSFLLGLLNPYDYVIPVPCEDVGCNLQFQKLLSSNLVVTLKLGCKRPVLLLVPLGTAV